MASSVLPKVEGYVITEKIGSGSYGTVYKALVKSTEEKVAVKCALKNSLTKSALRNIVSEIEILKGLSHLHIVQLKDFTWDENYIYIIMEYCSGGDLSKLIAKKQRIPEVVCQNFLQQLASALLYLREKHISHLDLKPQNILLATPKYNIIKLADFGLSQHLPESLQSSSVKGSPLYMAPEILLQCKYDARVDIWSVGVILYECLFGKAPFFSPSYKELAEKIKSNKPIQIPSNASISNSCEEFLIGCLQRNISKRFDFDSFFSHPFIDLEHKPSPENFKRAQEILYEAVVYDNKQNYEEALKLYIDGLLFLVPAINAETNSTKKMALRRKVDEYMSRTEIIKGSLGCKVEDKTLSSNEKSSKSIKVDGGIDELCSLAVNTPQMLWALDIAKSAELYEKEGSYSVALEKYELALGRLMSFLEKEPPGRRRELLMVFLDKWLSVAENLKQWSLKSRVSMADLEAEAHKSCCIQ